MQALKTNVAGVDVHKDILIISLLKGELDAQILKPIRFECSTMTSDLMAMGTKLLEHGVRDVALESTGIFWKPVHNVWSPMGINICVANASHVKNVPGRKTDQNDADWLAELHRYGLIRPSFVPDGEFQRLRLLARHRTNLVDDLARVKNRVEKVLQDGNIKWSSIVSDTFGASGLEILKLISEGVTNAQTLAGSITTNIKNKKEAQKALTNCFSTIHCFLIKELMQQYEDLQTRILEVENELTERMLPYSHLIEELRKIPGIDTRLAQVILAEATNNMNSFPDERKFAAWAGVASGNNESAGKKKDQNADVGTPTSEKH